MVVLPRTATALSLTSPVTRVSPRIETTSPALPSLVEDPNTDTTESAVSPSRKVESWPMLTRSLPFLWRFRQ